MRAKRKSNSVNRTEHEPYASYPLPQHTTHLEEAVAWVAAGRRSLRQAMRLFTVDKKTIKKNLVFVTHPPRRSVDASSFVSMVMVRAVALDPISLVVNGESWDAEDS